MVDIWERIWAKDTGQENKNDNSRDLLGYDVYLDNCMDGYTEQTQWLFSGLVIGCEYEAGVITVYDAGNSEMVDFGA